MTKKVILFFLVLFSWGLHNAQNLGLKWAEKIASMNDLYLNDIESDANGNYYITGTFSFITDFDPSSFENNLNTNGADDIFIAKYNSSGDFLWARSYGIANDELVNSIAVNSSGESVVLYENLNFPDRYYLIRHDASGKLINKSEGNGTINNNDNSNQIALKDNGDVVLMLENEILMMDKNFTTLWKKKVNVIDVESVSFDKLGSCYVACQVSESGYFFPDEWKGFYLSEGEYDLFVAKISSSGLILWSGTVGGSGIEDEARLETDGVSKLFLTYETTGSVDTRIVSSWTKNSPLGGKDVILSAYDLDGTHLWSNTIGGTDSESPSALTYSASSDEVYISTMIYPSYDGDPSSNITADAGPIYSYNASIGKIASWGKEFLNDRSFRAPKLEALTTGGIIASEKFVSFGLGTDVAPGSYDSLLFADATYDIYIAKYGFCQSTSHIQNVTICSGTTYNYKSLELSPGSYEFIYLNEAGCDSIFTLNVKPIVSIDTVIAICGDKLQFYDTLILDPGDYKLNLYNLNGCIDTVIDLTLFLTGKLNVQYSEAAGNHLFYLAPPYSMPYDGTFKVINCDNNEVVQTNQGASLNFSTLNPASAYKFQYEPSDNPSIDLDFAGCIVQTSCIKTNTTAGVDEISNWTNFNLYPNPAESELTIDLTTLNEDSTSVQIIDLNGKVLLSKLVSKSELVEFDITTLSKGIYTVRVAGERNIGSKRFIK
jgi:hypothetical protein